MGLILLVIVVLVLFGIGHFGAATGRPMIAHNPGSLLN
jgi:hypothetical protein